MFDTIALVGPTASGKSAAAAALAALFPIEIISMDSAQVYRGMDIGTAKPGAQERAAIKHHLIDMLDPAEAFSAAAFAHDAARLLPQIRSRGRAPLLVGGTMLYLKALLQGIDPMPSADRLLRAEIDAQARQLGWPALHQELARVDPVTAKRLNPNDAQRIQRALEVFRSSGRPLSAWHGARSEEGASASRPRILILSLEPGDRAWLHERIALRCDAMLANGLVQEVRALHERGDLNPALPSMRCVGYRQVLDALEGRIAWTELRQRFIAATRQLAKRQLTWLRSMPERRVVACDDPGALQQLLALASAAIHAAPAVAHGAATQRELS